MTSKVLSRLPVIKWVSIFVLIVIVVGGGWMISPYNSFEWFLKENLGQVSGYAILVVVVLYISFSLIEYLVGKNVRLNRWLQEVYRITREAQSEETEELLLKRSMTNILQVFEYDRAAFFLLDDAATGERLQPVAAVGFSDDRKGRGGIDVRRDSTICRTAAAGRPRVYENASEVAFEREIILGGDTSAPMRFALIPMRLEGKTTGALYVDRVAPNRRDTPIVPEEIQLLATYLDQVSVVLQRTRLLFREKELSKTLAQKIQEALERERTLEEKLRLSETLAALGEMAASLSHEIKNPLGGLDLYAKLLKQDLAAPDSSDDEKRDLVEKIIDGVKTLNAIVGSLLGYARVARGDMNTRISISDVIGDAAEYAKPEMQRLSVTYQNRVPEHIHVTGNFDQLRQVFLNLLLNAVQSMSQNGGTLTIQAIRKESQSSEAAHGWVVTEIADTGVGMTEEQKTRIFEDFYTTREKGTGLGLAISRKIIKVHGGEITFESEWKKGSTFRVYLPQAPATEAQMSVKTAGAA